MMNRKRKKKIALEEGKSENKGSGESEGSEKSKFERGLSCVGVRFLLAPEAKWAHH